MQLLWQNTTQIYKYSDAFLFLDDDEMDPLDLDFNHYNSNVVNFSTHSIEAFKIILT